MLKKLSQNFRKFIYFVAFYKKNLCYISMDMENQSFLNKLKSESLKWANENIISDEQRDKILKTYEKPVVDKPVEKKNVNIRMPHIIIALAGVLLLTGIILFYAANWKKMPSWLKMVNIYTKMLFSYAGAYYLLAVNKKKKYAFFGKALVVTGIIFFGVGIMLTAQIYHLNDKFTLGVLAWAVGAYAISYVTKLKAGFYISAFLLFLWNVWEVQEFKNINYLFIFAPAILFYAFYRLKDFFGVILSILFWFIWFYQINYHNLDFSNVYSSYIFIFAHIPLGVLFVALSRFSEKSEFSKVIAGLIKVIGWLMIMFAMLILSWPIKIESAYFVFNKKVLFQTLEFFIITIISGGLTILLLLKKEKFYLPGIILAFSTIMFLLPLGNDSFSMIAYHTGILALFLGMVYFYFVHNVKHKTEQAMSFVFAFLIIVSKFIGFSYLAAFQTGYILGYTIGFILITTVIYLASEFASTLAEQKGLEYKNNNIKGIYSLSIFFAVYAVSFKLPGQKSIMDADPVVLILLFMFIIFAVGFYVYLIAKSKEKHLLYLSLLVFLFAMILLFSSGPAVNWRAYSILTNLLLLCITVGLVHYSAKINSVITLNLSIIGFLLHLITRYVDLIWDMLSGSTLFIITGLFGIGLGLFINRRRAKLVEKMKASEGS